MFKTLAMVGLALVLAAAAARADEITFSADGVIIRDGNFAWLKVSELRLPLDFKDQDMRNFALTLHNKSVHVEGTLGRYTTGAGAGQVYLRPWRLQRAQSDGSAYGYGGAGRRGYFYNDTLVVPRTQGRGPIPSGYRRR
jgi:hypothetical protein